MKNQGLTLLEVITILVIIGVLASIAVPHFDIQREEDIAGLTSQAEEIVMDIKRLDVVDSAEDAECELTLEDSETPWNYTSNCDYEDYGIEFGSVLDSDYNYDDADRITIPDSDCEEISISSNNHEQKIAVYPTGHSELGECNND